jgi:hypothetical protein
MGQGADYLNDQWDGTDNSFSSVLERFKEQLNEKISVYENRHAFNKKQKVGDAIICCSCGKEMVKKSYQSQFCSNKGRGNCKDKYHNLVDDTRRARALYYNGNELGSFLNDCDGDEYDEEEFNNRFDF